MEKIVEKKGARPYFSAEGKIFQKIAKTSIYILVFLLPLFFLPWTSDVLDFNKQALLLILVLISLICWLISCLISNKVEINTSLLNLPVVILLLVSGVSTIFSLFRYGSFWGWPLPVFSSLLSLLAFIILYFIIANLFEKSEVPFLFLTLFLSGFLAAIFFILQFFGKFIFPFDFSRVTSFNTVGTVNGLAIYFSLLLILLLPLFFFVKRFFKIILAISSLPLILSLVLINFRNAWLVLLIGVVVLFTFGVVSLRKMNKKTNFVTLVMFFLIISLFFTFFRFSLPGVPAFPLEVYPSQRASIGVLKQLPAKSLILGSGPGTFSYGWAKYKPVELNQTIFWPVRFSQAASEILDRAITTGILGILTFFFLLFICLKLIFTYLLKKMESQAPREILNSARNLVSNGVNWFLPWGILASFVGLIALFFLYPANLSILFVFWLLVGCSALFEKSYNPPTTLSSQPTHPKKEIWDFQTSSIKALVFSFFTILILVLGVGLLILYTQKYLAEVRYTQGLRAWQRGETEESSNYILRAANFNPKMDLYWRNLSQIFLFRLNELLTNTYLSQEEMSAQAQPLVANAVNSANQATVADPNNVANWNIRGFVYRNMIGILGGADNWAINSYQKAAILEPTSPYILTEIGRTHLARSDLFAQQKKETERAESIKSALENLEQAVSLKADYAPANFLIAMVYLKEGKTKEAIEKLEMTKQVAPFDTGLAFQLGVIYYNDNQFDMAKGEFERAVLLDPNYSNARYFLGLVYDREGKKDRAIEQFVRIEEFNPENQEVKKVLANLRTGKAALEGVVPGQPPVEEKPPEQLEK